MNKYVINPPFILFLSLVISLNANAIEHTPKQPDFFVPESVLQQVQNPEKKSPSDILCQQHCGHGYFYNKRSTPEQLVCARYPQNCGERCEIMSSTHGNYNDPIQCIDFLVDDRQSNTSEQSEPFAALSAFGAKIAHMPCEGCCQEPNEVKSKNDEECEDICGECFNFDQDKTEFWGGDITVCVKKCCDPDKFIGWHLEHLLVKGREYRCESALQKAPVKTSPDDIKDYIKKDYLNYIKELLK